MGKSILKNVIYKSILNIFNIMVPLIIGGYAYNRIGKDYMGVVGYVESIYNFFLVFAGFGIYQYGLREISRIRDNKKALKQLFSSLFVISLISNISTFIIFIMFSIFAYGDNNIQLPVMIIYSITLLSNTLYVEWVNEALENYDFITKKTIIVRIIYIVLLLKLIKGPESYITYTFLIFLSMFLNNIISFIYISKNVGFDFKNIKLKRHVKFLILAVIMSNVNILYTQLDKLVLGTVLEKQNVSFYTLSQNIISMVFTLVMSVVYVTIPRLSKILADNDEEGYENLLSKVSRSLSMMLMPAAIGIFILAREIVVIYTRNPEYDPAIGVLKIFAFYMLTIAFESIMTNQVMYVKKREKTLIYFIAAGGFINVIFKGILVLTKTLSPRTAIFTTMIANGFLVAFEYIYAKRVLKLKYTIINKNVIKYMEESLPFFIIAKACGTLIGYSYGFILGEAIKYAVLVMGSCIAYYMLVLYIMKDEVYLQLLNKIISKVKRTE